MKFFFYNSVKSRTGQVCTLDVYLQMIAHPQVARLAREIGECTDDNRRGALKKMLPIICWQASFDGKARKNENAVPSGLYMADFDHVDDKVQALMEEALRRKEELDIVYIGRSISGKGVRIVAECRPEFATIAECQQWLSRQLGQPCDEACKDWARASYMVPAAYEFYLDQGIFEREPKVVYGGGAATMAAKGRTIGEPARHDGNDGAAHTIGGGAANQKPETRNIFGGARAEQASLLCRAGENVTDQTGGNQKQSNVQTTFKGLKLSDIAISWLESTGGQPRQGERNTRLHALALQMRYITDFNPAVMAANMPSYGLPHEEMLQLCASACNAQKGASVPAQMQRVVTTLEMQQAQEELADDLPGLEDYSTDYMPEPLPPMPPVFKEFVDIAPNDFKGATALCMLPMLGTLGSKLRSRYMSGKEESPSFQVTLEAEQAQGKSFIEPLAEQCLKPLKDKDHEGLELERRYKEEDDAMKNGSTKKEREVYRKSVGERKVPIIREIGATASLTKVLKRAEAAQGLHQFAMAVELDTVNKAFSRGFSNLTDFLRCAFDNSEYAQDYASDTSWSGRIRVYYNTLYSGTPGAVATFFTDSENGTMSRTLFVTYPDQFGKKMPQWAAMSPETAERVEKKVAELYSVSIVKDEPQECHWMDLDFLNRALDGWMEQQRVESVNSNDRVRNTFYRRCSEVAFRAGMLAFFLYGEAYTDEVQEATNRFAVWVAEKMLQQFLVRVDPEKSRKDNMKTGNLFNMLPERFTYEEAERLMISLGRKTSTPQCISRWTAAGKLLPHAHGAREFVKAPVRKR